jgi:CPA1 family monovalent cation:H+ antiporter
MTLQLGDNVVCGCHIVNRTTAQIRASLKTTCISMLSNDCLHMILRNLLPLFLLVAGFLGSEWLSARGADTGLNWENINPLIMHLCVPVILLHLGLKIPHDGLQQQWKPGLAYALLGGACFVLLSTAVLAGLVGSSVGFPLSAALLAFLLAISDLSAIPEIPGGLMNSDSTRQRLEIESLAAGALGGSAFTAFVMPEVALNPLFWGIELVRSVLISLSLAAVGWLFLQLLFGEAKEKSLTFTNLVTITASVLGLNWCVIYLGGSATLFAVVLALSIRNLIDERFWRPVNTLAVIALLVIAGASFTPGLFADRWLAMFIGAGLVLLGRMITMLPIFWLLFETGTKIEDNEPWLATFTASRGAIALALAISIPLDFVGWYTVQAVVYGGVLASMLSAAFSSIILHYQVK